MRPLWHLVSGGSPLSDVRRGYVDTQIPPCVCMGAGSVSRRREGVETPDYIKFAQRVIRAAGRRVASESEADLADLVGLQRDLDEALVVAVAGLRAQGHSWAYIAAGLGSTRQAAQQRFGSTSATTRASQSSLAS